MQAMTLTGGLGIHTQGIMAVMKSCRQGAVWSWGCVQCWPIGKCFLVGLISHWHQSRHEQSTLLFLLVKSSTETSLTGRNEIKECSVAFSLNSIRSQSAVIRAQRLADDPTLHTWMKTIVCEDLTEQKLCVINKAKKATKVTVRIAWHWKNDNK